MGGPDDFVPWIPAIRRLGASSALLGCAIVGGASLLGAEGETTPRERWREMDYGPFLTASIEAPQPRTNIAYKGIALPLGRVLGRQQGEAVVFDTDLLRYSAGWRGDFVALKGVVYDGEHWAYPEVGGTELFGNPMTPGWGSRGQFKDPRPLPYGPLPRAWAHWKGLYLQGHQVVLSYTVGEMEVLELPALAVRDGMAAFSRTLNLGASAVDQTMQVAFEPGSTPSLRRLTDLAPAGVDLPADQLLVTFPTATPNAAVAPGGGRSLEAGSVGSPEFDKPDGVILAEQAGRRRLELGEVRQGGQGGTGGALEFNGTGHGESREPGELSLAVRGAGPDARWVFDDRGSARLELPKNAGVRRLQVLMWRGPAVALPTFAALVRNAPAPADLRPLTLGGPARWGQRLETTVRTGDDNGPYAVDTLTEPDENPWKSWMRFSGLDFFPGGERLAISTWSGDVWVVDGLGGATGKLTWQRVATGLFQPLGLRVVDGRIYVLGRDQITRLHDLNGDGEADFYENFNNDCMVSEHFHEFATDLKVDAAGNFYYMKCARHALEAVHPHHGTLLKVSKDGSRTEVVARGFRAVNGLGIGPRGEITCIDNQGHWMPGNRLNWVRPGGWYGNSWAWNPDGRTNYDQPLCWMHNFVDRSGGTQLWVPTDGWGPMRDELVTISYGMGHMFLVLKQAVGEVMQGAVTRLPLEFETGVMRGVFHPVDHQLYVCGLYGWAGNKTRAGGLYRVRYTGKPLGLPNRLEVVRDGFVLGFTDALDPGSATDPGNYNLQAWNYRWSAQYGSPDFRLNGQEGRDTWPITSATLSADRRRVFLQVPNVQPVMQYHLTFNLKRADGGELNNFVHGTIHRLGDQIGKDRMGADAIVRTETAQPPSAHEAPGLALSLNLIGQAKSKPDAGWPASDVRRVRLPALYVPAGSPASPWIGAGRFRAVFRGYLKLEMNDEVTLVNESRGAVQLSVNGAMVLESDGNPDAAGRSRPVPVRAGLNAFELIYLSPSEGDAYVRVSWQSPRVPLEPIPPTACVHDPAEAPLRDGEGRRQGLTLWLTRQCVRCHQDDVVQVAGAMPELPAEAPNLTGVGDRLNADWLAEWIRDPRAVRTDAWMPRLLHGATAGPDAQDMAAFLASQRTSAGVAAIAPAGHELSAAGEKLFSDLGCVACHRFPMDAVVAGDTRVELGHVPAKWQPPGLVSFLRNPTKDFPWTRMPDFKLTDAEATALAAYILERGRGEAPTVEAKPLPTVAGDVAHGRELVSTSGCLACHRIEGLTDRSQAPGLAAIAETDWRRGCLATAESSRGSAPDFGWSEPDVAALRRLRGAGLRQVLGQGVAAEFAERHYQVLRCNACHPRDTETDFWSGLPMPGAGAAKAVGYDDEESGPVGGSVHLGRPPLTYAGEKLYAGWVAQFMGGGLPYKPRPELQGRMPAFPAYAREFATGVAHQHGYAAESAPTMTPDAGLVEVGRRLTLVDGGFSCVSCHDVGEQKALAGKDTATVNFAAVAERLRISYFWRYVKDPPHVLPSTMMPRFIGEDGTTPIKGVFDGDPERQFTAIWHYLVSLRRPQFSLGSPSGRP